jgi:hypothetical protein
MKDKHEGDAVPDLEVIRVGRRWWIDGLDRLMGPYFTRGEAERDERGVRRFYRSAFGPRGEEFVHGPKVSR